MTIFTPSPDQLKETLGHVYYEIVQLTETLQDANSVSLNNALVESRLIHVRALLDFFQKKTRSKKKGKELDDVLSIDYGFAHQTVSIPLPYQERLNKDLAHLTYSRSQRLPKEKPWPYKQVVLPILLCCMNFSEHIISNFLTASYPNELVEWKALAVRLKSIIASMQDPLPKMADQHRGVSLEEMQ